MASSGTQDGQGLLKTLSSIQFGIVVLIAIAVVAVIGTLIPQNQPPEFYFQHYGGIVNGLVNLFRFDITYRSPLFIGLMFLFALNLILCSLIRFPAILKRTFNPDLITDRSRINAMPIHEIAKNTTTADITAAFNRAGMRLRSVGDGRLYGEKGRIGYLGSSLVHLSLLIFIAGGMVSLMTSMRGYIILEPGQSVSEATIENGKTVPLGFSLELDRFEVAFYEEHPGRPKSYVSYVTVTETGTEPRYTDIRVNHPLTRNGFTVYQSSYGPIEHATESVPGDMAVIAVSLKGMPEEMPPIKTFEMTVGETMPIPGLGDSLSVTLSELYRDYQRVRAVTGGANPTVRLDVRIHDAVRWSIYAFQSFPGMNMPMEDNLPLLFTLEGIRAAESTMPVVSQTSEYYTVLGVSSDNGIPLMWLASVLMVAGFVCSFYIRPRRIWILEDGNSILIGAQTRGDNTSLRTYIRETIRSIQSGSRS